MRPTLPLSLASLVLGLFIFVFTVLVFNTPVGDVGMLSTVLVFVLFGVVGLALHRVQVAEGQ